MTERDAFIRHMLEDPLDDAPRLIFADWLEENGEAELAEFIRVQIAISREDACDRQDEPNGCRPFKPEGKCFPCQRNVPRRQREHELLTSKFGAWTDNLPDCLVAKQCPHCMDQAADWETNVVECGRCECTGLVQDQDNVEFRRGFVEAISLSTQDFLDNAARLFAAAPILEVRLSDKAAYHAIIEGDGRPCWTWWKTLWGGKESQLPPELWEILVPKDRSYIIPWDNITIYNKPTEDAANKALSQGLVTLGRRTARLPPLHEPTPAT